GEASRCENPPHELIARDATVWRGRRGRHDWKGRRQLIEAMVPPDLLDEIDLAQQVDTKSRCDNIPAVRHRLRGQNEATKNSLDLGIRHRCAEQHRESGSPQMYLNGLSDRRIHVDDWFNELTRTHLFQQSPDPLKRDNWCVDIGAPLEPRRCLGF